MGEIVLLVAAMLAAGTVQATTGFGFGLVAAPATSVLLEPTLAVPAMLIPAIAVNAAVLAGEGRAPEVRTRDAAVLVAFALPGAVIGALLLGGLSADALQALVGIVVLAAVALQGRRADAPPAGRVARALAGGSAGALTSTTAVNGPPLALYVLATDATRTQARDTLAFLFVVLNAVAVAVLLAAGELEVPHLPLLLAGALAGYAIGRRLFAALDEAAYRRAVRAVLLVGAIAALVAAAL